MIGVRTYNLYNESVDHISIYKLFGLVGFKDPKYFATSFKRVMGVQPKEYFLKVREMK